MKNKIIYHDEPIEARVIENFLPRPEDLILTDKKAKVTLTLTQKSIDFLRMPQKNMVLLIRQ